MCSWPLDNLKNLSCCYAFLFPIPIIKKTIKISILTLAKYLTCLDQGWSFKGHSNHCLAFGCCSTGPQTGCSIAADVAAVAAADGAGCKEWVRTQQW